MRPGIEIDTRRRVEGAMSSARYPPGLPYHRRPQAQKLPPETEFPIDEHWLYNCYKDTYNDGGYDTNQVHQYLNGSRILDPSDESQPIHLEEWEKCTAKNQT